METTIPKERCSVHRTHCCKRHGCKYGYTDCPVEIGLIEQDYPCEDCDIEAKDPKNVLLKATYDLLKGLQCYPAGIKTALHEMVTYNGKNQNGLQLANDIAKELLLEEID